MNNVIWFFFYPGARDQPGCRWSPALPEEPEGRLDPGPLDLSRMPAWRGLGTWPWGRPTSLFWRRSVLGVHWKDWCWSWNSNTLATWCEELTHLKRPWCWERLRAGGEGDDRRWDSWMASPTQWTWVWVDSGSWWWTGRPGVVRFMGSQRVGHDWLTELNLVFRPLTHLILSSTY